LTTARFIAKAEKNTKITSVKSYNASGKQDSIYSKMSKCELFVTETKFLGLTVGRDGFKMDPEKVKTILAWTTPRSATELCKIGLTVQTHSNY